MILSFTILFDYFWMISYINPWFYYQYEWYYEISTINTIKIDNDIKYYLSNEILLSTLVVFITTIIYSFHQFLIFTRLARIGETSIHSIIFIQILLIDIDWTFWNESGRLTVWRFGISIHHSIIQYQTRKKHWTRLFETTSIRSDRC